MNHNLLRRRQLLFYLGLGLVGIGAATTAFPNFRKVNAPSISPTNRNNSHTYGPVALLGGLIAGFALAGSLLGVTATWFTGLVIFLRNGAIAL
ncbi:MAG: hypothetical protein ACYTXC_29180 [Nostoc sp.]